MTDGTFSLVDAGGAELASEGFGAFAVDPAAFQGPGCLEGANCPIRAFGGNRMPPMNTRETFAVALAGEIDRGWLVEASDADEAIDIVYGTVPRAREVSRDALLVWTECYYRGLYLTGDAFPSSWSRL